MSWNNVFIRRPIMVYNAKKPNGFGRQVDPGTYKLEKVDGPSGSKGDWLVIKARVEEDKTEIPAEKSFGMSISRWLDEQAHGRADLY